VNGGSLDSVATTVSINISAVNDPPIANSQSVTTSEDTALNVVLSGSDVENSPLAYGIVSWPTKGSLSGAVPNLTYTPRPNYNGSDSFTFKVNDGALDSATATVSVNVTPVNDAPVTRDSSARLKRNKPTASNIVTVTSPGDYAPTPVALLASDGDGGSLQYLIVLAPTHGTLSGTTPNVVYTPDVTFHGRDEFIFQASDGKDLSDVAFVTITDPEVLLPTPPVVGVLNPAANGQENLDLHVDGVPGVVCELQASTDLVEWTTVATAGSDVPTDYQETLEGNAVSRFYRALLTTTTTDEFGTGSRATYAGNVFGRVTVVAPPGYSMVANPLSTGSNTVSEVFSGLPDDTLLYKYSPTAGFTANTFLAGTWTMPGETMAPGEGAFFWNPTGQDFSLRFTGEVMQGTLSQPLAKGFTLCASMVPQAGRLDSVLGFVPEDGDTVYRFDSATGSYTVHTWLIDNWDHAPEMKVGEAFWITRMNAVTWVRTFTANPAALGTQAP